MLNTLTTKELKKESDEEVTTLPDDIKRFVDNLNKERRRLIKNIDHERIDSNEWNPVLRHLLNTITLAENIVKKYGS